MYLTSSEGPPRQGREGASTPEKRELLVELFERAAQLKRRVYESVELASASFRELVEKARDMWVCYEPEPEDGIVRAVDSGWNYRLYPGFYIYALKAAAVDESTKVHFAAAEVDIVAGDPYGASLTPELVLKYMAEGYEHEISLRAAEGCELVLVDGSLIARLEDVSKRVSSRLRTEYAAHTEPLKGVEAVAFVSKYSHDNSLLGGPLGDVFFINMSSSTTGYTKPFTVEREGMVFSVFYVRLSDHANALRVEVPAEVGESYVRAFLDRLCGTAVQGYPYSLRVAHEVASLPHTLMDMLCRTAGLTGFYTAREVLEA